MIDVHAQGMEAARARLAELHDGLRDKAVRAGLVYAAKPVKDAMKTLAPSSTGALRRSIGHQQLSATAKARLGVRPELVAVLVGPKKVNITARQAQRGMGKSKFSGEAWLVHILSETGARPHAIWPKGSAWRPGQARREALMRRRFGRVAGQQMIDKRHKVLRFNGRYASWAKHPGMRPTNFVAGSLTAAGAAVPDRFMEGVKKYLDRKGEAA